MYASASLRELAGGFGRAPAAARRRGRAAAVARPVDAEHGLLLFEQADDAVQPLPRLRAAGHGGVDEQKHGGGGDQG